MSIGPWFTPSVFTSRAMSRIVLNQFRKRDDENIAEDAELSVRASSRLARLTEAAAQNIRRFLAQVLARGTWTALIIPFRFVWLAPQQWESYRPILQWPQWCECCLQVITGSVRHISRARVTGWSPSTILFFLFAFHTSRTFPCTYPKHPHRFWSRSTAAQSAS